MAHSSSRRWLTVRAEDGSWFEQKMAHSTSRRNSLRWDADNDPKVEWMTASGRMTKSIAK